MRRILLVAVSFCLLVVGAAPTAARPGAYALAFEVAWADWIEMNGRTGTFYGAIGIRGADTLFGAESVGVVFKGRCFRYRDHNGVLIMCSANGIAKTVGPHEFWVDPTLDSASLDMTADGFDHSIDWTGRRGDEHGAARTTDRRTVAYNEMWKDARMAGRVYGERIPQGRSFWKMAFLYEGVGVRVNHALGRLGIHVRDDGAVRIERTFRIAD